MYSISNRFCLLFFVFVSLCANTVLAKPDTYVLSSPNKRIQLHVLFELGKLSYELRHNGRIVLEESALGLRTKNQDFSSKLSLVNVSKVQRIQDVYEMMHAKRRYNKYVANKIIVSLKSVTGAGYHIHFQLSDDGLVFRYEIPEQEGVNGDVINELTTFKFPENAKAWLQPVAVAKSGWEQTNPSYEEHYQQGIAVGTPESTKTGWIYPALFQSNEDWVLISEAGLDGNYCATRLHYESPEGEYAVAFPDVRETMTADGLLPKINGHFYSPWRVVVVGGLGTIVESHLGLDVVDPRASINTGFIKPGKASWSWINSKDDFIVYDEQVKYIDFAADMKWQYCLIDVNWDTKIGYDKMKALSDYAASKQVGLILWYNSAGDWNTVGYTPKNKLLKREDREKEFQRLQDMGVKGVKIDFFGGDGRSVIAYYIDILKDAAKYELLVNFHGATLPRGWSKTYPHLMTVEAVRGFEMVTFGQDDADKQATLSTMLPFTRNTFDPMDFTPMNLSELKTNVKRRTTSGFELATSVLFVSGIQHYAESPDGLRNVPDFVKDALRILPDSWDEVKYLSGYPGKDVVIARRSGKKWYIAGINGENKAKTLTFDSSGLGSKKAKALLITDGLERGSFIKEVVQLSKNHKMEMKPNGGFLIVVE